MIFQAGASAPGRDLAARFADGVYAVAWDFEQALEYRQDVLARAATAGRDPDSVTVMPGLVTYVAPSEAGAREL
ncbi:LLM class flavin-dependent oxidoreductase [Brevibacterium sp. GP-SGM9]|uniref:LLM class flavin-dependent oxidoreductase n=1 Tax=Brevibacterium sp. GP-SGM9 TaxID=3376990 RepID=UPI0039A466D0